MLPQKVISRQQAVEWTRALQAQGKRVGYTSGAFDILHAGHVQYLEQARALCDALVVGLNSDESIKRYKDPSRPLNSAQDRAAVVAALRSVDAVFVFNEDNNNENIKLLRPNLYIKAGDYKKEKLTSASIVESYGGVVQLVPFVEGRSTTALIERIARLSGGSDAVSIELTKRAPRPTAFLDRDGTLIEHIEYLSEPDRVKLLPGVIEGLKKFQDNGFALVVVTNQQGIGLGYCTKEDFYAVNREFLRQVSRAGISIDKVYFCPHSVADQCECRKPGIKLIERAVQEVPSDLSRSVMVGDMTSDIECGSRAGLTTVLVGSGRGGSDAMFPAQPTLRVASFADVVDALAARGIMKA